MRPPEFPGRWFDVTAYRSGETWTEAFRAAIRNVRVSGLRSDRTRSAYLLRGYPEQPLRDIAIRDSSFARVLRADVVSDVEGLSVTGVIVGETP
ncbi:MULTISPECIES: hypothetical protein [Nonomuraea]|uniref:Uncharacterized protein n=1 Tax=Nonomuraea salmonea TaxID=46181 RepID=A0ABV5P1Z1_9ACTN